MKTQILNDILDVVSSVCEVSTNEIVSHCKRNEVVDARCIFVYSCSKIGFSADTIARFLERKRVAFVNDALHKYSNFSKLSLSFRLLSRNVAEKLASIYPTT